VFFVHGSSVKVFLEVHARPLQCRLGEIPDRRILQLADASRAGLLSFGSAFCVVSLQVGERCAFLADVPLKIERLGRQQVFALVAAFPYDDDHAIPFGVFAGLPHAARLGVWPFLSHRP
jgi:hypothetical protein